MDEIFQVDVEAFPDYSTTYIKIEPIEPQDNSSFFEVEIPRDELTLAKFLRKIRPLIDMETPMTSFKSFARETLAKNINTCYCTAQNLNDVIELYRNRVVSPEKEFPGEGEGDKSEILGSLYPGVGEAFITESVKIEKDVWLNEKLIKRGSTVSFFYKGLVD